MSHAWVCNEGCAGREKEHDNHAPSPLGLRRLPRLLCEKFRDDLINHLVNQRAHFIRGFRLDGMRDKNRLVLWEAKR